MTGGTPVAGAGQPAGPGVRRAAVLGKPIAHSLSPVIHNAGYAAAGLAGWSYQAIECAEAELPDLVAGLGPEWAGLSLTMPLKEVALTVADEVAPVAAAVGAANTLVHRPDGTWYADNTDVAGMVAVLSAAGVRRGAEFIILGAGGTARAALGAAASLGSEPVTICVRRRPAGEELARVAHGLGLVSRILDFAACAEPGALGLAATEPGGGGPGGGGVLVSTVPAGAADGLGGAAMRWRPGTVVFDVVYAPWPTPLAAGAAAAGCRVVSGLDLLLAQAVGQFEHFTAVAAPVAAMAAALAAAQPSD